MVEVPLLEDYVRRRGFGADAYVVTWKSLFEEPLMSMLREPQSCQAAHHVNSVGRLVRLCSV